MFPVRIILRGADGPTFAVCIAIPTDIVEIEGKITGYLEYKTRNHKTARLVQKQGLSMPLVAPVWGVGKIPWVLEFVKVA